MSLTQLSHKCDTCQNATELMYTSTLPNGLYKEHYICTDCMKKELLPLIQERMDKEENFSSFLCHNEQIHAQLEQLDIVIKRTKFIQSMKDSAFFFNIKISSFIYGEDVIFTFIAHSKESFMNMVSKTLDTILKDSKYPPKEFYEQ